jgi:hypothetical protein
VYEALDELHRLMQITLMGHGAAPGADTLCRCWAERRGVTHTGARFKAEWTRYGKAAGPIRNRQMLMDVDPCLVLSFPGDRGTLDCTRKAIAREIPCIVVFDGPLGAAARQVQTEYQRILSEAT